MSRTDPHTTTNYSNPSLQAIVLGPINAGISAERLLVITVVGGLMESPNGEEVYMYLASPGAMGHGEIFTEPPVEPVTKVPSVRPQLGNNSAISLLRVRKHGFVAVEGPTRPLSPLSNSSGCRPVDYPPGAAGPSDLYPGFTTVALEAPSDCSTTLLLVVNAKTSVAGFVQVGVLAANASSHEEYRLCNSDPLRGNMLNATASWGGGSVRALPGGTIQLEVVLVAAKLFSLQFVCT